MWLSSVMAAGCLAGYILLGGINGWLAWLMKYINGSWLAQ